MLEPVVDMPPIITVVGDAGVGKTSLASKFPKPIFIRAEDGLSAVNPKPAAFPVLQNGNQIFEQLTALYKEEHDYQTLVIDSITKLNALFEKDIVDADPKAKSINTANGGYGAGISASVELHWRVKRAVDALRAKGMAIVMIAHADIERVELPDLEAFSRYSIRMHKKQVAPYSDDVDMVGYLHGRLFINEGKVIDSGEIILTCTSNASRISKNRYGIKEPLQPEFSELSKHIPFYNNK